MSILQSVHAPSVFGVAIAFEYRCTEEACFGMAGEYPVPVFACLRIIAPAIAILRKRAGVREITKAFQFLIQPEEESSPKREIDGE